ncbi:MAG TPA: hypothetical protein VFK52_02445 [Nocardioidaceae bacterium]|nr:hypothetical protein [Nocardioidaceae bacterium]
MPDDVEPVAEEPQTDSSAKAGHPRRRRVIRSAGIGLVVLLLALAGGAWWAYRDLEGNLQVLDPLPKEFPRAPRVVLEGKTQPLNLLVIGTDTRVGQKGYDENVGGDLSDTTILLHISASRNRAYGGASRVTSSCRGPTVRPRRAPGRCRQRLRSCSTRRTAWGARAARS